MNIIKVYILFTFLFTSIFYSNSRRVKIIWILVLLGVVNELISYSLKIRNFSYAMTSSVYLLCHNILWMYILYIGFSNKFLIKIIILLYIFFGVFNFLFLEGIYPFNFNTFIIGAFIYISLFIYESFYKLQQENLSFFLSNNYLLLSAPVIFFFGVSFVFGFKSAELADNELFCGLNLYQLINYFVNIIYYTLINIYIYREKKLRHAG